MAEQELDFFAVDQISSHHKSDFGKCFGTNVTDNAIFVLIGHKKKIGPAKIFKKFAMDLGIFTLKLLKLNGFGEIDHFVAGLCIPIIDPLVDFILERRAARDDDFFGLGHKCRIYLRTPAICRGIRFFSLASSTETARSSVNVPTRVRLRSER